jgi:DNA transposition AAA+ family ATPase
MVAKNSGAVQFGSNPTVAMLKNVLIVNKQMKHLITAAPHLPRMGVFAGYPGLGKSFGAIHALNAFKAYYVEVKSTWTKKAFLLALLKEMGITDPPKTNYEMVEQIAEQLVNSGRPVIIDEADYLVDKNAIDLVRDIYEASGAAILIIGEENLPKKLKRFERFDSRILDWQYAQPCDIEDVKTLSAMYAPGVSIAEDLCAELLRQTMGVTRRIAVNLDSIAQVCKGQGLQKIDREGWGKRAFYTGNAPTRGNV